MAETFDVKEQKRLLRLKYAYIRDSIPEKTRKEASLAICERLKSTVSFEFCKNVLVYSAIKSEPDLKSFISAAFEAGKGVYFPKTCKKGVLEFYKASSFSDLEPGVFGISEPKEGLMLYDLSQSENDLCVVPGLCFDKNRKRIGYGKGYYDRFLSKFKGIAAGVCFSECISGEALPFEKRYDRSVDFTLTEMGIDTIVR
ncbi:MAG: 5-formyltetrahydrofolate cyclo-ligase [Clostridiales bacterium]|nr:5-formyltetrahydrofolate cyclo-ligase [Clostridiales bacterium]